MAYTKKSGEVKIVSQSIKRELVADVQKLPILEIKSRGIRKETAELFGVRTALSEKDGKTPIAHYFPRYNSNDEVTGYMKRDLTRDKGDDYHFTFIGSCGASTKFFGQDVAEKLDRRKTSLICVEGEWDVLSAYQACYDANKGGKYDGLVPFVVGLNSGTVNAVESFYHNKGFVEKFDEVCLAFDNDKASPKERERGFVRGYECRQNVAAAMMGSNITTIEWGKFKDASDYLQGGFVKELAKLVQFDRISYTPDKLLLASEIDIDEVMKPREKGVMSEIFPELDAKMQGFRLRELTVLCSPSSTGKCHGKGQLILMHDLTTKKVEDVCVGDLVMGDDGTARTVLKTHCGSDMIYKVTPYKGTPYTVNSEHLLVLESNSTVPLRGFVKDQRVHMSAKDYVALPKHYKEQVLSGVRANLRGLGSVHQEDAYILGLWLAEGDTTAAKLTLATKDMVLHEAVKEYASKKGYSWGAPPSEIRNGATRYSLRGGFLAQLREWGVLGNKHIPREFMMADYESRVALLSGFLDGDGYISNNTYEMTLKKNRLADDIALLAKTLGLHVVQKDKFCKCQNFEGEFYSRIHISGDTGQLKLRVERKRSDNKPIRNQYRDGLTVSEIGIGEYYGFEVDGNHLYCLPDMTITHNSTVVAALAYQFMASGHKLGCIFLEEQSKDTIQRLAARHLRVNFNNFRVDPLNCGKTEQEVRAAFEYIKGTDLTILDHFGSMALDDLMAKIKHMVFVQGIKYIILDHLSLLISGMRTNDERKELDLTMTELASFCAANDVHILAVSHINRSGAADFKAPKELKEGESFWVQVTKESMRGSSSLEQLAWNVIGLEPEINWDRSRGKVRLVVLKNREHATLGVADTFSMDETTGDFVLYKAGSELL